MTGVMSSYMGMNRMDYVPHPTHRPQIHTTYLDKLLDPERRDKAVRESIEAIQRSGVEFDAVAFTGMSGALLAPILAYELDKSIIMVRKPGDRTAHSELRVEGDATALTYIIADDFVNSGTTLGNIVAAISEWQGSFFDEGSESEVQIGRIPRKCVGVVTARDDRYNKTYLALPADGWEEHGTRLRNLNYRGE